MEMDEPHGLELVAASQVCKYVLCGDPAIEVVVVPGVQVQWVVTNLLGNLFETADEESLHEHFKTKKLVVEDYHFRLWPGESIPGLVPSKHAKRPLPQDDEIERPIFLKRKSVSTSVAFAWIGWSIHHNKRSSTSRKKSREFLQKLFENCLESQGRLSFRFRPLGLRNAGEETVEITTLNPTVDCRRLWPRSIHNRFHLEWETCRLNQDHPVSSPVTRPKLLDIIFFGLDTKCKNSYLLAPFAYTWLAQFGNWLNLNVSKVSSASAFYLDSLDKNRVDKMVALHHSMWKAIDFALHENDACEFDSNNFW